MSGGKGGGGGVDTSGIEQATREATALQKQVYDEIKDMAGPYSNLGTGAVGRLSDLLGISGGSMMSRDQIYNELLPQYTSTQGGSGGGGTLFSLDGQVYDASNLRDMNLDTSDLGAYTLLSGIRNRGLSGGDPLELFRETGEYGGARLLDYSPESQVTDYEALNAAVEERLAGQETPEDYGSLLERFDLTKFEEDPGAQFRREQAQQALERSMAAQGVTLGGGGFGTINPQVAQALNEQQQGLASQEYQSAYNRYVNDQLNTYNMLTGAAGIGQGTLSTVAGAGQNMATNVGQLGTGLASAQMNAQLAQQSRPSMFGSLLGAGTSLLSAPSGSVLGGILASDFNLKENVKRVGEKNGYPVYHYNYIGDDTVYEGVMAQDIVELKPSAVRYVDGYMHVDYDQLGIQMEEVN
jgi:hypothetical protein